MLKVTFSEFFKNEAFGGDNLGSQRGGPSRVPRTGVFQYGGPEGGKVGCPEQTSFNMRA